MSDMNNSIDNARSLPDSDVARSKIDLCYGTNRKFPWNRSFQSENIRSIQF